MVFSFWLWLIQLLQLTENIFLIFIDFVVSHQFLFFSMWLLMSFWLVHRNFDDWLFPAFLLISYFVASLTPCYVFSNDESFSSEPKNPFITLRYFWHPSVCHVVIHVSVLHNCPNCLKYDPSSSLIIAFVCI